jgi:hypothetical protein
VDLPHDRQDVRLVKAGQVGVQVRRGLEEAERETDVRDQLDPVPQDDMGRVLGQRLLKALQDLGFCLGAVVAFEGLPGLGLRRLQELEQQVRV